MKMADLPELRNKNVTVFCFDEKFASSYAKSNPRNMFAPNIVSGELC